MVYPKQNRTCSIEDCESKHLAKGFCKRHYYRWRQYGDAEEPLRYEIKADECSKCGGKQVIAKGLCSPCYDKSRRERPDQRYYKLWQRLRYYAKREDLDGYATLDQLLARFAYYGNRCWICGGSDDSVDHVKPRSSGGANWPCNLRPICRSCNARKRSSWPFPLTSVEAGEAIRLGKTSVYAWNKARKTNPTAGYEHGCPKAAHSPKFVRFNSAGAIYCSECQRLIGVEVQAARAARKALQDNPHRRD